MRLFLMKSNLKCHEYGPPYTPISSVGSLVCSAAGCNTAAGVVPTLPIRL